MAYIGQSLTEGTRRVYTYVATASQTTFNAVYTVGAIDVHQNGVLLAPTDYTATDGTTVVLGSGAAANDEITITCHNTFSVADTVSSSQGGTFSGNIGIGTLANSPDTLLRIEGAAPTITLSDTDLPGQRTLIQGNTTTGGLQLDIDRDNQVDDTEFSVRIDGSTRMTLGSSGSLLTQGSYTDFETQASDNYARVTTVNGSAQLGLYRSGSAAGGFYIGGDANKFRVYDSGFTPRMEVDSAGRVSMPYQPAFCHQGSGVQSFSGASSAWTFKMSHSSGVHINRGNHYNYSTGVFTAPVAGAYKFTWQMAQDTSATGPGAALVVNGSGVGEIAIGYYDAYATHGGSIIRELQANDTAYINVTNYNSTSFGLRLGRCIFSGHLIG